MLSESDYVAIDDLAEDDLLLKMPPPPPRRLRAHLTDVEWIERIDHANDAEVDPDSLDPPALRAIGSCVLGCICLFWVVLYVGLKWVGI